MVRWVGLVAILVVGVSGCAPRSTLLLGALRERLAHQYHACVPLGWKPVPVAGTFYPGSSVTLHEDGVWIPATWIGSIPIRDRDRDRETDRTMRVLDELVRRGVLERQTYRKRLRYHLHRNAVRYFYEQNDFGNNPAHITYLCYSTIVPDELNVTSQIMQSEAAEATFRWHESRASAWADTAFVRSHSVILAPTQAVLIARFARRSGEWVVTDVRGPEHSVPTVVDRSVWR